MSDGSRRLQYAATLLALLALVPVVLFVRGRGESVVWLSFVSVLLIAGSLYLAFGPSDDERAGAGSETATE